MKRLTLIICGVLLWVSGSFAQRHPFQTKERGFHFVADTITLSDCLYIVDHLEAKPVMIPRASWEEVHIYNAANHPGRYSPVWPDGSVCEQVEPIHEWEHLDRLGAIVSDVLTDKYMALIGEKGLRLTLYLSSQSGRITDIYFSYDLPSEIGQIPIDRFRQIERMAKEELIFTPTKDGEKLDYILLETTISGKKTESTNNIVTDVPALELPNSNLHTER